MPKFIDRDKALSFPLANGKYDHENANQHFIYGLETYKEWLEQLPTLSPDDVRGVGEWEDNYPILAELECLRCKNCNKLVQIGRYCANCGERKKGAETWIKKKSRSQLT